MKNKKLLLVQGGFLGGPAGRKPADELEVLLLPAGVEVELETEQTKECSECEKQGIEKLLPNI